ncbi:hypothetical protein OHD62_28215 [Mesorhizobium sp. YC-39]|uniref:hypothetical protein n=1 Tax=unclassified Mesorhizobium TaxID=325217 RepID=UPI0021E88F64|nr:MULTISPECIES: hypothetical protein [unclassified Mesorhizobium]MCV3208373.1 hypothetical protein [Mesorhizobium sp. YC-2]MCV3232277.1 hypothetical protein [Mesorhizobium sp. YC-39]
MPFSHKHTAGRRRIGESHLANGVCKLTGATGKFVDSHLIPKALTKPEAPGHPFWEAGSGSRPMRRYSSWYDNRLVTQSGEDILEKLDGWAIKKLRFHRLVWSGWGPMLKLSGFDRIPGTQWGLRPLHDPDWLRLRLFFLSLLWRAAASDRREFKEMSLPSDHLEQLRKMVVTGDAKPLEFYPISLTQLSTLGVIHNQTPFPDDKWVPEAGKRPEHFVPIFRFYFDGLISHFDRRPADELIHANLDDLHLGYSDRVVVTAIPYEESFQQKNIETIISEAVNWRPR